MAFYAPDSGTLQIVQVFLVTELSAAALSGYAAKMSCFYAFVPAAVLPFGACLALYGVPAHMFTATLLVVWVSVIVFLSALRYRSPYQSPPRVRVVPGAIVPPCPHQVRYRNDSGRSR